MQVLEHDALRCELLQQGRDAAFIVLRIEGIDQGVAVFGKFQRMPEEKELNELQRNGNKRWDLGLVYTVIAGVLNLLVIYDAFAGPMFRDPPPEWLTNESESATAEAPPPVTAVPPDPPPADAVPEFTPPAVKEGGAP